EKEDFAEPQAERLKSFKDSFTKYVWSSRERPKELPTVLDLLDALNQASSIYHLRQLVTRGTRLEELKGDRKGQISLRINDQWRLCFEWKSNDGAYEIEIVDYHK
ncbi:MAG TPA: type II toxin-antitoxin system RelE/ParE family toxin, partial [Alphaproteobacteria bacterium]|nr:type II toxin-antitoxin system RelE/ParE family toxin [Alphaproteobacteria bacterium]